jgi:DNA modification methylase
MPEGEAIKIKSAKGRPMLTWVGKRPLRQVTAFPAQHVESFAPASPIGFTPQPEIWRDWPEKYPQGGLLFHGDNKEVLAHMLANGFRGKVKLIYIDPPFDSGADYVRKVQLRGVSGVAKLDGESYALGEQIQYTDIWANDNYLQFMYERLLLLKELLAEDGVIGLHCDYRRNHYLRCLLDESFGADNIINEIVWKRRTGILNQSKKFGSSVDSVFFYAKSSDKYTFNQIYIPYDLNDPYIKSKFVHKDAAGRLYRLHGIVSPSYSPSLIYTYKGYESPANGWAFSKETMEKWEREGKLVFPKDKSQRIQRKQYLDETPGKPVQSLWDDIRPLNSQALADTEYPTQKPTELLARVIDTFSNANDLILDCFIGSGTTAAVAQWLGRRWIACDINKSAIQTTGKRLQTIICEQGEKLSQGKLAVEADSNGTPSPSQLSFSIWRVNDYDLQIQHNEAMELACEHVGITRTRNDAFFEGTRGKALAKIIPFSHPVTMLDLEEIKRELAARPEEERDITVICLGKETAVDSWLEEWNRLRRIGHVPNRIEIIELRTDPKYGKFFLHQPAKARVKIKRVKANKNGDKVLVAIEDFISPTIVERLKQQAGILTPEIDDWRAMVDSVMIDTAYNGEVFNIALSDLPAKKADLVKGEYELPAPKDKTTVAVKITDMLGEEVLLTKQV